MYMYNTSTIQYEYILFISSRVYIYNPMYVHTLVQPIQGKKNLHIYTGAISIGIMI